MSAYIQSSRVTDARKKLEELKEPGPYSSKFTSQKQQALQQLQNRKPFSYDLDSDALYQQYAQRYTRQGRRAMEDTLGKTTALTGGYGNSYAQTAAQQIYQEHLTGLNDLVPELYQQALDRYTRDLEGQREDYRLLSDLEQTDYQRYADALNRYLQERQFLAGRYDAESAQDYTRWADDRDYNYRLSRDAEEDRQWQKEFDLKQAAAAQAAAGKSGGRSGGSRKKKNDDDDLYKKLSAAQAAAGAQAAEALDSLLGGLSFRGQSPVASSKVRTGR